MSFGARLRFAREAAKKTQTQLGQGLGTDGADVSKSVVLGWEKDRHFPRADQLGVICARLGVSADNLLFGDESASLSPAAIQAARMLDSLPLAARERVAAIWHEVVAMAAPTQTASAAPVKRFAKSR